MLRRPNQNWQAAKAGGEVFEAHVNSLRAGDHLLRTANLSASGTTPLVFSARHLPALPTQASKAPLPLALEPGLRRARSSSVRDGRDAKSSLNVGPTIRDARLSLLRAPLCFFLVLRENQQGKTTILAGPPQKKTRTSHPCVTRASV